MLCLSQYSHLTANIEKQYICLSKDCDEILEINAKGVPRTRQPCGHKFLKEDKACFMIKVPIRQQLLQYLQERAILENNDIVSAIVPDRVMRGDITSGGCYRANYYPGNHDWNYKY